MVSLRFYGGVGEIGGNKILLEDGDTRIWFDFGQSFNLGLDYFTGWLQPRASNGLGDYFEFDLVPRISGLYAGHLLANTSLGYEAPAFDAVFISHAHFDHVGHLCFIDPDIPVYCGAGTRLFLEAAEETGPGTSFGEHDYRFFRTGDKIRVGDTEVEPIHVDHSIPAAYGFIIHTSKGAIVYTGDLRAHGPKHEMTEEFIERATESKPAALICEGSRMETSESRRNLSEAQVLDGVKRVIGEADVEGRSVFYTHNNRDMDRFRTFYTAARECGRRVAVMPRVAYILWKLVEDEHLDLPDPMSDDGVAVYYRRKKSGEYAESDYYYWERPFLGKKVTADELRRRPTEYVIHLDFNCFTELIDIRPQRGAHFIYSMSERFSEDSIEEAVMRNWLNHFTLSYHQLHASGHMSRRELMELVKAVRPRKLFPVHTENPELFGRAFDFAVTPEKGKRYPI